VSGSLITKSEADANLMEHVTVNAGGQAIVGNISQGGGGLHKSRMILMKATYPFQNNPRCSATSKRAKNPCQAPAVNGWTVCCFHGARGGAPKGERNGMYKSGLFTNDARTSAASSPPFFSIRAPCYAGSSNAEDLEPGRKPTEQGRKSCYTLTPAR
jgi:hypothetical protein